MIGIADNTMISIADNTMISITDNTMISIGDNTMISIADNTMISIADQYWYNDIHWSDQYWCPDDVLLAGPGQSSSLHSTNQVSVFQCGFDVLRTQQHTQHRTGQDSH